MEWASRTVRWVQRLSVLVQMWNKSTYAVSLHKQVGSTGNVTACTLQIQPVWHKFTGDVL
jgi:hypothetical protein